MDDGEAEAEVMSRRRAEAFRKFPSRFCVDFLAERSQPTMGSSTRRKHVAASSFRPLGIEFFSAPSIYHILKFREVRNASRGSSGEIGKIMYCDEGSAPPRRTCEIIVDSIVIIAVRAFLFITNKSFCRGTFTCCVLQNLHITSLKNLNS